MKTFYEWLADNNMTPSDAWKILGLPYGSEMEKVNKAYRRLVLKAHPDKNRDNPDASRETIRLTDAKNILDAFWKFAKHHEDNRPIYNTADRDMIYDEGRYVKPSRIQGIIIEIYRNLLEISKRPPRAFDSPRGRNALIRLDYALSSAHNAAEGTPWWENPEEKDFDDSPLDLLAEILGHLNSESLPYFREAAEFDLDKPTPPPEFGWGRVRHNGREIDVPRAISDFVLGITPLLRLKKYSQECVYFLNSMSLK